MQSLFDAALECILCAEPQAKVALTRETARRFAAGEIHATPAAPARSIPVAGRPELPRLVHPRELAQRKLTTPAGRAALVHAVAHIEFNAINLAWDAVYRFRDMPAGYYADWIGVALDEAKHFELLAARLADLGHAYGDFDAHNGLWDMALKTEGSCLERMALVPRVLEARGLDVTPGMIARLAAVGDRETIAILEVILAEEVAHVAAGTRWFEHCCAAASVDPAATFAALVQRLAPGIVRGPFNEAARRRAGFDLEALARLAS